MYRIVLCLLLLSGCSSDKNWYNIKKDPHFLYGIGTGISIEEAKKVALSDLASQIKTTVSSQATSFARDDTRIGFEGSFIQDVSNKVFSTSISGYEVVSTERIENGRFAVVIAVEKQKLITEYKEELGILVKKIESNYNLYINNNSVIKKYAYIKHVINLSYDAKMIAFVLSVLDSQINLSAYSNNIVLYEEQMSKTTKKINFIVEGDNDDVQNTIAKQIAQNGFNVQNSNRNENTIKVKFKTIIDGKTIFDENIVSMDVVMKIMDYEDNLVHGYTIKTVGNSISTMEDAKKVAILNLDKQILEDGILNILGL